MSEKNLTPFFIVGLPRSGTTLLSVMLGNHPEVYLSGNSVGMALARAYRRFLYRMQERKGSLEEIFQLVLEDSYQKRLLPLFGHEPWLSEQEVLSSFLERSVLAFAERQGKRLWGDKTPELNFHLAEIDQLMPSAKFIHLVRDPRSNALSLHRRQHYDLVLAAQYWRELNTLAQAQQHLYGRDRFLPVRYEDLLLNSESVMRRVCAFLHLDFHPAVLQPGEQLSEQEGRAYVKPSLQKHKVDSWKAALSEKQLFRIEQIVGSSMLAFGYEPVCWSLFRKEKPLSPRAKFWYKERLMWRMLFKGHREQMINRQLIRKHIPLFVRIKNFVFAHAKAFFSEDFLRLFGYRD